MQDSCATASLISPTAIEDIILRLYGPNATGQVSPKQIHSYTFDDLAQMLAAEPGTASELEEATAKARWIVFAQLDYNPEEYPGSAALRDFLAQRSDSLRDKRLVALSFSAPYYLDTTEISKLTAYFGVYGHTAPFLEMAVRALFREFSPSGAPPVSVSGINYDLIRQLEPAPGQIISVGAVGRDHGQHQGGQPDPARNRDHPRSQRQSRARWHARRVSLALPDRVAVVGAQNRDHRRRPGTHHRRARPPRRAVDHRPGGRIEGLDPHRVARRRRLARHHRNSRALPDPGTHSDAHAHARSRHLLRRPLRNRLSRHRRPVPWQNRRGHGWRSSHSSSGWQGRPWPVASRLLCGDGETRGIWHRAGRWFRRCLRHSGRLWLPGSRICSMPWAGCPALPFCKPRTTPGLPAW